MDVWVCMRACAGVRVRERVCEVEQDREGPASDRPLRSKPLLIIVRTLSQMRGEEDEEEVVPHPLRRGHAPPGKTKAAEADADAAARSHSLRGELF